MDKITKPSKSHETQRCKLALSLAVACIASNMFAGTYTWVDGSTNWESEDSYSETGKPGQGDTVKIPKNATATVDDDSVAFVGALARVQMVDISSVLIFNVTTNSDVGCEITSGSYNTHAGTVYKRGAGDLTLSAEGDFVYYTDWVVEEGGALKFKQDGANSGTQTYYGSVTVNENAVLYTKYHGRTRVRALYGSGMVTNVATSGTEYLDIYGWETTEPNVFSGVIGGGIKVYSRGNYHLTGTNNTYLGECSVYHYNVANTLGIMGLKKLGMKGEPSSSGVGGTIFTREYAGKILYLGEGETTDKDFQFGVSTYRPNEFDAGATGGITFTGKWKEWESSSTTMSRLVLTGSNTVECVLTNEFNTYGGNTRRITKKGTGTWRLAHHPDRKCAGVFAVQNGTLKFDSIAASNSVCALGLSTILYQDYTGTKSDDKKVDYALMIGGDSSVTGTLEYAGADAGYCSTRPLMVSGAGRFRTSGGALAFGGVFADDGGGTLIFDAANGITNTLSKVTDGTNGVLSIVKEGSGTLMLSGTQDWSGLLNVREGTVLVNNHYEYFRLTLKENAYACTNRFDALASGINKDSGTAGRSILNLSEFAMYDAEGTRLNLNMSCVGATTGQNMTNVSAVALLPGQAAIENGGSFLYYNSSGYRLQDLFDEVRGYNNGMNPYCSAGIPYFDKPSRHCKVVMRLAETTTAEVVYYDLAASRGVNKDYFGRDVTAYALEGSADGRFWETIAEDNEATLPAGNGGWYGATRTSFTVDRHALLTNLMAIAVAPNATLVAKGPVAPIKKLVLDAAGAGTIDGFEFAEEGELEFNGTLEGAITIPITIQNSTTASNMAKWAVVSGGRARTWSVVATDSSIMIAKRGMVFVIK